MVTVEQGRIRSFFEGLVVLAIILVLIQTFLEDVALIGGWSWEVRKVLLISGFIFDLFFTFEFLIRFFSAAFRREAGEYLLHRKGWIDLFASVPLLLFNSGPLMAAVFLGGGTLSGLGGVFNVLKVAKAIRVARILRLLRVLKVFKKIKYTGSAMAQRHVALITSLAVTVTVATLFLCTLIQPLLPSTPGRAEVLETTETRLLERFDGTDSRQLAEALPTLLIIKEDQQTLYSRYENSYYRSMFGPTDYQHRRIGNYDFFLSLKPELVDRAAQSLAFFVLIVLLVLVFLLYYSPHFALTISDPVHIMRRGFAESGYKLEVEIPTRYRNDDIYRLAALYNREYLPLKERMKHQEDRLHSDLSLDTIGDILVDEE
ncbi:MAG: ion transporter [Spirochaetaceae bacterium]|nr:ion transporter [Spirochaetaceae bacterium]MCF7951897.1 ion transporter [Spirochaetaceae bacterium]